MLEVRRVVAFGEGERRDLEEVTERLGDVYTVMVHTLVIH